jgi:hypothetical protein
LFGGDKVEYINKLAASLIFTSYVILPEIIANLNMYTLNVFN